MEHLAISPAAQTPGREVAREEVTGMNPLGTGGGGVGGGAGSGGGGGVGSGGECGGWGVAQLLYSQNKKNTPPASKLAVTMGKDT